MEGRYTRLYEEDADAVSEKLAHLGGVAPTLYYWLYSRSFCCGNVIRISMQKIADLFGVKKRETIKDAADHLQELGLIKFKTKSGNGGGATFSIINPAWQHYQIPAPAGVKPSLEEPLDHRSDGHNYKEHTTKNTKNKVIQNGKTSKYADAF